MLKQFFRKYLGIDELERRVDDVDQQVKTIELVLNNLGGDFKNRTKKQLNRMGKQIGYLLGSVEALIERGESQDAIERAKALRRRLRYNQGKINKTKEAKAGG
jgi:hypothetical protein